VRFVSETPQITSHNVLRSELPARWQVPRFVELLNRRSAQNLILNSHDPGNCGEGKAVCRDDSRLAPPNPTWTNLGIPRTASRYILLKRGENGVEGEE
jgi:hypothetical protein